MIPSPAPPRAPSGVVSPARISRALLLWGAVLALGTVPVVPSAESPALRVTPAWGASDGSGAMGLVGTGRRIEPRGGFALFRRAVRPTRARTYPGWSGIPERRLRVTEPLFAARIASMAERSAFARARLEAIGRSGVRVWVVTPEALAVRVAGAEAVRGAWVTLLNGGRDAVAVVDLAWLRGRVAAGELTEEQFLADLDLLLGHELFIHVGSIGQGRDTRGLCLDPEPVPGAMGCSVVEENLLTHSLDASRPLRPDYRHTPLRADGARRAPRPATGFTSFYYPELEPDGWEDAPYHEFLRAHPALRGDTRFQRWAREAWERGERNRVDGAWVRFEEGVEAGRAQDAVEDELLAALSAPAGLDPEDRFRARELELVRAGKHDHAREMRRRRLALTSGRDALSLDDASARVVREMAGVSLAPAGFVERVEALHRAGEVEAVRRTYDAYLRALEAGEDEAAVRARLGG